MTRRRGTRPRGSSPVPPASRHGKAEVLAIHAALADIDRTTIISLHPAGGAWDEARVAMGPFPGRLRLDHLARSVLIEVVACQVSACDCFTVIERMGAIRMPPPSVGFALESETTLSVSYALPYAEATRDELIGLIAAGVLYASALAAALDDVLAGGWRRELEAHGYVTPFGFDHDPRELLRGAYVRPWPAWD